MQIKSLEWVKDGDEWIADEASVDVSYYINEEPLNDEGYKFTLELPDGDEELHESLEDAKLSAEEHWQDYASAIIKELLVEEDPSFKNNKALEE